MPAGDGTGPRGQGPMTGRGAGYCSGYDAPGWANPMPGRGYGAAWGGGYGGAYGGGYGGGYGGFGRGGAWGGRGGGWRHRNVYYATGVPGWARAGYGPAWEAPQGAAQAAPPAWGYGPYAEPPSPEQETEFLRQQAEWLKQQLDAIGQRIEELGQGE